MTDPSTAARSPQPRDDIGGAAHGDSMAANDTAADAPLRQDDIAWARSREIPDGDVGEGRGQRPGAGRSLVAPAIILGVCAGALIVAALLAFNAV